MGKGFGENNYLKKSKEGNYQQLLGRAFHEHNKKNFIEAEIIYEKLFKLNIKNQIFYFNYGSLLESREKIDKAFTVYKRAIKFFPMDPNFYSKLGLLKKKQHKFDESENLFLKSIELDNSFEFGYINLANLYLHLEQSKKAEEIYRKVLETNENSEFANLNLGNLLMDFGNFEEAKKLFLKTIEINPKSSFAYFCLSKLKDINKNENFKTKVFNDALLNNQNKLGKVNIHFARANIYHFEKNYKESQKNLVLGNSIKLLSTGSDAEKRIKFSNLICEKYSENLMGYESKSEDRKYIFIVGMPRSGSTLIESIISLNENVFDLGESEALPLSYRKWVNNNHKSSLFDIYNSEIKIYSIQNKTITDKNLANYSYLPLIIKNIMGSKIIHCSRNPLDNILSIYRSNFTGGYSFSSSLIDIAKVLINQQKLMQTYKSLYPDHIFTVNYDDLVSKPESEIRHLINWLKFEWNENYLYPHLNSRKVCTTSKVQVRAPINKKSLSNWKNYTDLLRPVIEYFEKQDLYIS